jgi:formylglycine-generating enzyme required for sulfatase activity
MKTWIATSLRLILTLGLASWVSLPGVLAQQPPGLSIQLSGGCANLTLTGDVGVSHTIQCLTNLTQTNDWLVLTNLTLTCSPCLVVDPAGTATGWRFYRAMATAQAGPPANPNPGRLAWIAPGTFVMGSPTTEARRNSGETQHGVTLTQGFYMGKYPVTQGEYQLVIGSNPSYFTPANGQLEDTNRPVEQVIWSDATNYCARLTQQENTAGRLPAGWVYRLPTESEWEYACRAGTTTAFHYGSALHSGMANFMGTWEYDAATGDIQTPAGTFLMVTTTVGSYQPNAWGLYDMHGNVWEWCQDWYGPYPADSVSDPQGPASGSARVQRGGSWYADGKSCRSAQRFSSSPSVSDYTIGLRIVLAPAVSPAGLKK